MRPIDAVQVLKDINWHHKPTPVSEFESGFNQGLKQAMWIITHAPTLTPPMAKWELDGYDEMGEQRTITIDERCEYDDRYCSKCGKQSPDNFLNFCGYCGAPMTDEAVEMVMERLEALGDEDNGCP